jgi:hypothetical protein
MSWRIETAGPLALMRELPDAWAQTCFLRPPRDLPEACLVAVLDEVHRVLRDDGTVWVTLPGRGHAPGARNAIEGAGWLRAGTGAARMAGFGGLELFSKQPRFYFHPRSPLASSRPRHQGVYPAARPACCSSVRCRPARRAWCMPARADDRLSRSVIEWCILASSSARACDVCGAPCKRLPVAGSGGSWRWHVGCSHTNDRGRCLVLDPFCGLAPVGVAAVRLGRSYLGAERHPERAMRARRRLRETLPEPRQ